MATQLGVKKMELGKLGLKIYGPDKRLLLPDPPGRMVNGMWSVLHEVGDRQLIFADEVSSHTFVRNYENHLYVMQAMDSDSLGSSTYGAGTLGMKDRAGNADTFTDPKTIGGAGVNSQGFRAASGVDTEGILVGTSSQAFSYEDFDLIAKVAEGTSSGQMSHVSMDDYTVAKVVYNSCTLKWTTTYERFFNNNSGGSIVIEEVGLYWGLNTGGDHYLAARDLLGCSALTIADSGQLKITYTITSPAMS